MKAKRVLPDSRQEDPGGSSQVIERQTGWQITRKTSIQTIDQLSSIVSLNTENKALLEKVVERYRMRITRYYLSLIKDMADPFDPIRMQCFPSPDEMNQGIQEGSDPLDEEKTSVFPCLVHRYPDRALLLVTGECFMYCRHCTRKRLWWSKKSEPSLKEINQALDYVRDNPQIREIIISGGDPLTLPTERLECILRAAQIPHIEVMRIGTRAPVVFPQRIDDRLCAMLEKFDNLWINVQFNHPREITPESAEACRKLQRRGIPVSNQSVLLKGVNDSSEVMTELCRLLQKIRVRPYYLFQCDPVVGAGHFRTSVLRGIEIIEKMRGHIGGMCIPWFVVDGVGARGKIPLGPNYLLSLSPQSVTLRNFKNEVFVYENPRE